MAQALLWTSLSRSSKGRQLAPSGSCILIIKDVVSTPKRDEMVDPLQATYQGHVSARDMVSTPQASVKVEDQGSGERDLAPSSSRDVVTTPKDEEVDYDPTSSPSSSNSVVEVVPAEITPWARRQSLALVKQEEAMQEVAIYAISGRNRKRPTLAHHYLPDVITLIRDPETDRVLSQPLNLEVLGTGGRRRVYDLSEGWVLKLTSEPSGHNQEPAWTAAFPHHACAVRAHGLVNVRIASRGDSVGYVMHYEIQAKLTIMLRDVAPTYGLGTEAMRELLAVYVCCITFMEACCSHC